MFQPIQRRLRLLDHISIVVHVRPAQPAASATATPSYAPRTHAHIAPGKAARPAAAERMRKVVVMRTRDLAQRRADPRVKQRAPPRGARARKLEDGAHRGPPNCGAALGEHAAERGEWGGRRGEV